jgi:nucleoside-diphosphate-sugar epimerase
MKQKVNIFGCGWLGLPLAITLIKNGFEIKGSTTSTTKIPLLNSKGISPFLLSLESGKNNFIPFLAAEILVVNIPSKNVKGFEKLISYIKKSTIQKVIFISSTSVYENSETTITEENAVSNCELIKIEQLFQLNAAFETTVIRFAGLLGYDRKPGNFFKNGRIIPNPEGVVNMIHQDDCIAIIEQVIVQNCWNETLNACANTHPTRRDFYTKSFSDIGLKAPIFNENDEKTLKIISNQKVKKLLNYTFKYPDLLNLPKD